MQRDCKDVTHAEPVEVAEWCPELWVTETEPEVDAEPDAVEEPLEKVLEELAEIVKSSDWA